MRLFRSAAIGLAMSCLGILPASAEDKTPCGAELVCASKPETVMAAMEKAGLKPKLTTDNGGDPMIESDEAAYHFDVYFYDCNEHRNCASLRFEVLFDKAPENTTELANKWNVQSRLLTTYVRDDQKFVGSADVSTVGGLNAANFGDVLDWWTSQLDALGVFFKKELNLPDAPAKDAPAKK
ncbi:MAG: YbjN domain-containing protein [Sphingomonas sp.]